MVDNDHVPAVEGNEMNNDLGAAGGGRTMRIMGNGPEARYDRLQAAKEPTFGGSQEEKYRKKEYERKKWEAGREAREKAAKEAVIAKKKQDRIDRFAKQRADAKVRKERLHKLSELDDFEQGLVNKSITSMKKYRDQSGYAKWDLQEVKDRPAYGLSRIAAIREALADDEETHNDYLGALRSEMASNKYNSTILEATKPTNKGKYFAGDVLNGFRLISASI